MKGLITKEFQKENIFLISCFSVFFNCLLLIPCLSALVRAIALSFIPRKPFGYIFPSIFKKNSGTLRIFDDIRY